MKRKNRQEQTGYERKPWVREKVINNTYQCHSYISNYYLYSVSFLSYPTINHFMLILYLSHQFSFFLFWILFSENDHCRKWGCMIERCLEGERKRRRRRKSKVKFTAFQAQKNKCTHARSSNKKKEEKSNTSKNKMSQKKFQKEKSTIYNSTDQNNLTFQSETQKKDTYTHTGHSFITSHTSHISTVSHYHISHHITSHHTYLLYLTITYHITYFSFFKKKLFRAKNERLVVCYCLIKVWTWTLLKTEKKISV